MQRRFHELDKQLRDCERTLFLFEQIYQTFSSILDRRTIAMRCKLLFHFFGASLLFGDVELQELYVMGDR